MSASHTDPTHRQTEKWLEKSLVAPSPSLIYERSDGEKAASEQLIHEKAKTEWWNREITRFVFGAKIAALTILPSLAGGILIGLWIAP